MEKKHKQRLSDNFPESIDDKPIVVLEIPDEYKYMDSELVESIETSVSTYLNKTES